MAEMERLTKEANWVDDIKYADQPKPEIKPEIKSEAAPVTHEEIDPLPTKAEKVEYLGEQVSWFHAADFRGQTKKDLREGRKTKEDFETAQKAYEQETDKLSEREWKLPDGYELKELKTKNEIFSKLVALSENFDDLYKALHSIEPIESSTITYSAQEIIDKIESLRKLGPAALQVRVGVQQITKTYGIRDKFEELLSKEPAPKPEKPSSETQPIPIQRPSSETQPIPVQPKPVEQNQGGTFEQVGSALGSAADEAARQLRGQAERVKAEVVRGKNEIIGVGQEFAGEVKLRWEKVKNIANPVMGFLKQRVAGLGTFGWWDVHSAEDFRVKTGEAGKTIEAQSELMQHAPGPELPQAILERQATNMANSEKIMASAEARLRELAKRRDVNGQPVLTEEKLQKTLNDIRARLTDLADGQVEKDNNAFKKIIRTNLDQTWWLHYVWAGIDLSALLAGGMLLLHPKAVAAIEPVKNMGTVRATGKLIESSKEYPMQIRDSVWTTLKKLADFNGVKLTNLQLMDAAKDTLNLNNISERTWADTAGRALDSRHLPAMALLKLSEAVKHTVGLIK